MTRSNGQEISRNTSVKLNLYGMATLAGVLIGAGWLAANKLNAIESSIQESKTSVMSEITRLAGQVKENERRIDSAKKRVVGRTKHGFHRPDAMFYCREIAEANRVEYPGFKCPDPYKIPMWINQ